MDYTQKITLILKMSIIPQMEESSFKSTIEPQQGLSKRKGREMIKKGEKRKRPGSGGEILQKKAQLMMEKRVVEEERGAEKKNGLEMEAREEEEGSSCFHILSHTPPKVIEEYKEQNSYLMANEELPEVEEEDRETDEELGQQTDSFHFLSLRQLEEKKGEEKDDMAKYLKAEKTCWNRSFHILSEALSEELKYELYLVQNLWTSSERRKRNLEKEKMKYI